MKHVLTILAVSDFQKSLAFYRAAFDFKQTVDVPVYAEFELDDGRRIGIYARESFGMNTGIVPNKVGMNELSGAELYFFCDDPAKQCAKLVQAGAVELSAWQLRAWGDEAAYYRDPDGHVIVIARTEIRNRK